MNLFRELVNSNVAGCANEHRALTQLHQMVHDGGRRDCLSSARRSLDEAEGSLESGLDGIHLRVIQLRQARSSESFTMSFQANRE